MFPVTVTLHDQAQLNAVLNALRTDNPLNDPRITGSKAVSKAADAKTAGEVADKVIADTSKTAEKLQEKQESTATTSEQKTDDAKTYTVDDAKQLTNKVVAAGKRDEMVALLKEFKVAVASKLPADQIAPFCQKAEALL